jgi:hypothetical protein
MKTEEIRSSETWGNNCQSTRRRKPKDSNHLLLGSEPTALVCGIKFHLNLLTHSIRIPCK